jgi:hypothetical protein
MQDLPRPGRRAVAAAQRRGQVLTDAGDAPLGPAAPYPVKVLLTGAGARMRPLLELALPTFERFAGAQGYRLHVAGLDDGDGSREARRQARWAKVALLRDVVRDGASALWLDADALVCRFDRDIVDDLPADRFQGLVLERFATRVNPNTGVWLLRAGGRSAAFLDAVADIGLLEHAWTDQAAVCRALGWTLGDYHGHGAGPGEGSPFLHGTTWLHPGWNALTDGGPPPRIRHYAGLPLAQRRARMAAHVDGLRATGVV